MRVNRRRFLHVMGMGAAGAALARLDSLRGDEPRRNRPNLVFILADDMGYGDLQCLNRHSRIPTPNFNALAAGGMTFTDAHSGAAVCTPTRYGVLTGRYAWRTRLKRGVLGGYSPPLIDTKRTTIASLLQRAGYTTACVGKWHVGLSYARAADGKKPDFAKPLEVSPKEYGFEYSFIVPASLDMPPYIYIENGRATELPTARQAGGKFPGFIRAGEKAPGFDPIKTLDVLTGKATGFVARQASRPEPFFLYLALTAPHKPTSPAKRFRGKTRLGPYGDFVAQVDWSIGQVVGAIEKAGLRKNTLLVFSSDNGSYMFRLTKPDAPDHVTQAGIQGYRAASHRANHVFRGTKADIYEGGHHVPFLASWPGHVPAASRCEKTLCLTDLMATFAAAAGATLPDNAGEDSFNALPLMLGRDAKTPRAPVVHHSANGTFAVRECKWKLILSTGSGGREKPAGKPGSKPYRLFDISADISETADLAAQHPDVVARLTRELDRIKKDGRSR